MSESRLAPAFDRARREGRAAFIPYLTAGDPAGGGTLALARALDRAGADVLELGVPFSDPIADGPVLQRAASRALEAGTTLPEVWRLAAAIFRETSLALVLFTYFNPLLRRGLARAAREARASGFDAVLVTDLPPEEAGQLPRLFHAAELDTVFLVSPTSSARRMERAARASSGFVYAISRRGTTGPADEVSPDLVATVRRARRAVGSVGAREGRAPVPVAVGFGISTAASASAAAALADGVVVGSALVAAAEEGGTPERVERMARELAAACNRPSAKAR